MKITKTKWVMFDLCSVFDDDDDDDNDDDYDDDDDDDDDVDFVDL